MRIQNVSEITMMREGNMRRIIVMSAVIATVLTLLGNTAASAAVAKRLHFDTCSTSDSIGWARGTDSPLDGNHQALLATVGSDNGPNPPYNCAEAYSFRTGIEGLPVASVKNLSFDYLEADSAGHGGAPRISVLLRDALNNLHIAYLTGTPDKCGTPISTSGWDRADFTGDTTLGACTFYDDAAVTYTSDGAQSAWAVFAAAHPDYTVTATTDSASPVGSFLVMDEAGTYHVDRLAMQNLMFIRSLPQYIKNCPTEASC
jgi:hypothetical protein